MRFDVKSVLTTTYEKLAKNLKCDKNRFKNEFRARALVQIYWQDRSKKNLISSTIDTAIIVFAALPRYHHSAQ
jgi:hypothetical protein